MANVKSRIDLKCRVCIINDMTDPHKRGPLEGKQHFDMHKCETDTIDENEWRWRFETAVAILCSGEATTYGTYLEDAIGGLFV